jgi:hypothetical protein
LLRAARWISTVALLLAPAAAPASDDPTRVEPEAGTTSIRFDERALTALGIRVLRSEGAVPGLRAEASGYATSPGSWLELHASLPDFEGFRRGSLAHEGGPVFELPGGAQASLVGFEIAPAAVGAHGALELRDRAGRRWFVLERMHFRSSADGTRAQLRNVDVELAPELARQLGWPEAAGAVVGVADLDLSLASAGAVTAGGGLCDPGAPGFVDVVLTEIDRASQGANDGSRVSVGLSAWLRNDGTAALPWGEALEPDETVPGGEVGPHPYLAMSFYRISDGVLRQLGRSDVKHAFFAQNQGCACPGDNALFPGCGDNYGVNTNLNPQHLGPRDELGALAGAWQSLGSHFDGQPADDFRDHGGQADHDSFEHRLVVPLAELQVPEAEYFVEGWYIAPGDVALSNSLGHRRVAPTCEPDLCVFPFLDVGPVSSGSMLDEWVPPPGGPGEHNALHDTGEGRLQLAARARQEGELHRHEWALMNFDFDRRIRALRLPLEPGETISAAGFDDGDGDPGTDWSFSQDASSMRWDAPQGGALDWGSLASFRFHSDRLPRDLVATLEVLEPGEPGSLPLEVQLAPEPGRVASQLAVAVVAGLALCLRLRAARSDRASSAIG